MKTKKRPLRTLSVLLTVAVLFGVFACLPVGAAAASELTEGDYWYTVKNGEATIVGYTGKGGDVVIPSTLGGYPVTVIACAGIDGIGAFNGNTTIKTVVIPESVKEIDDVAFARCSQLTHIELGSNVERIRSEAFYFCEKLENVTFPDSLKTIGGSAFFNCTNIKHVVLPDTMGYIGSEAFAWSGLTTLDFSGNSTTPGLTFNMQAFGDCYELVSVRLPNTLRTIGHNSFSESLLKSIEIPLSVTSMEWQIFPESMTDIYCLAEKKPEGWHEDWIYGCPATVHWGMAMPKDNVLTDEDSDVSVTFPEDRGAYYTGASLTAKKLESGNSYDAAKGALSAMYGQFVPYDLSLTDAAGETLPVSGKIKVSIPIPGGWTATNTAAYYIGADGKAERLACNPSADGNAVEFETDHFSVYAIANLASVLRQLGDIGGDGAVDTTDYLLLKRTMLGTFTPTDEQRAAADLNGDGSVDTIDYLLLKRVMLGTYVIK